MSDDNKHKFNNGNIWRILDSKDNMDIINNAPNIIEYINQDSKMRLFTIQQFLTNNNIQYELKSSLIRGLDYYNDIVFEIITEDCNLSVGGGGRYDGLMSILGSKNPVNAIGFAVGVDRLILSLDNNLLHKNHRKSLLINVMEHGYQDVIQKLRNIYNIECISCSIKNMYSKYSDKYDYFMIFGIEWIESKQIIWKDLRTQEQIIVDPNIICGAI